MEEKDRSPRGAADSGDESLPGNLHAHRVTNFYIDNILRPDFGRRKEGDHHHHHDSHNNHHNHHHNHHHHSPRSPLHAAVSSESSAPSEPGAAPVPGEGPSGAKRSAGSAEGARAEPAEQCLSSDSECSQSNSQQMLWPAWVYCTRYSDRPSSGPRSRKPKKKSASKEDKRPRTAFTAEQLQRLKAEFQTNRYLTEQRRTSLAHELGLNESQIKIWFQNKRAKIKKASGTKNTLALHLMAQGLYNHASNNNKDDKSDSD